MIFHRSRKQSNRSPLYYSVRKLNCLSYSPKQRSGHCWLTCYISQSYFDLTWWFSIQMLMSVRNSWTAATTMPTVTTLWARMNVFAKMVLRETVACVLVRFNWGEHFATPCKLYRKLRPAGGLVFSNQVSARLSVLYYSDWTSFAKPS